MQCSAKEEMPQSLQTIHLFPTKPLVILDRSGPAGEAGRRGNELLSSSSAASLHGPLPVHIHTLSSLS